MSIGLLNAKKSRRYGTTEGTKKSTSFIAPGGLPLAVNSQVKP